MPEGRRRRCPNVINIFRARRVEKDSLPLPFLHPPRLVLFSPGPNFLADAPSAEGPPQIFNLHFSFPHPLPLATYSSRLIPLYQPSLSSSPSPPFRKGPRLNSQRPHREESVNATGKREWENVELPRARTSRDSSKAFLLAETPISSHLHGQTWEQRLVKPNEMWVLYISMVISNFASLS